MKKNQSKFNLIKLKHHYTIFSILLAIPIGTSYSLGPNDPSCYELGSCDFFAAPIETISEPFEAVLGIYMYPVIWGIVMGFLYLRTESTMVVGIVGVMLSLFITFSTQAQQIGLVLLFVSIGVVLYQLISIRIHFAS